MFGDRFVRCQSEDGGLVSVDGVRALERLRGSAQDRADLEALGPES